MGKGIDAARVVSPEHAQVMDDFKDQLLIALINRIQRVSPDGKVRVPAIEVDGTGDFVLEMAIVDACVFEFQVKRKQ